MIDAIGVAYFATVTTATILLTFAVIILMMAVRQLKRRVRELKTAVSCKSFVVIRYEWINLTQKKRFIRCVVCLAQAPLHLAGCDFERQDMIRARARRGNSP